VSLDVHEGGACYQLNSRQIVSRRSPFSQKFI
jgi:hypothetical protein